MGLSGLEVWFRAAVSYYLGQQRKPKGTMVSTIKRIFPTKGLRDPASAAFPASHACFRLRARPCASPGGYRSPQAVAFLGDTRLVVATPGWHSGSILCGLDITRGPRAYRRRGRAS